MSEKTKTNAPENLISRQDVSANKKLEDVHIYDPQKDDEDEITAAKSIFDEIVEETERD